MARIEVLDRATASGVQADIFAKTKAKFGAYPSVMAALTNSLPVIAVGSVGLQTQFQVPVFEQGTTRFRTDKDVIAPDTVDRLVEQFDAGEFDVVAVGRALLADPTWVNRVRTGALDGFTGYEAEKALASLA